ncbi:response regulator [Marinimicrobium sp. ABcell2]|uniref:response regulator n=1 Tax=Marinimicrobium sp. ABcell2 TaxID=3069751 RepID=UPI0027ADFFBE|nr:response regulator [Marinimicrobium sp. ABcell2]MDQ2075734.1 response regulator [Marinimicrobium sp. ABcell2]
MPQILLAEDDSRLAKLVKSYLEANDFQVDVEDNGNRVAEQVRNQKPDMLILDIMLPGKDGLTLCQELRPEFKGPILMLTARNEDADQILGLEFGADDYVIKPVEPRILLARIRALLRRVEPRTAQPRQTLEFGRLRIDDASRSVHLGETPINLSSHEFDLLWLLAQRAGEVVKRDVLFQELHGRPYDGLDRTIDVRVSQLRKKLGDNTDNPQRIKTVWGRGYLFIADAWGDF